jgi:hypothetical protein
VCAPPPTIQEIALPIQRVTSHVGPKSYSSGAQPNGDPKTIENLEIEEDRKSDRKMMLLHHPLL